MRPSLPCAIAAQKGAYANAGKRLRQITEPRLFETPFQSLQPFLWERGLEDWHLVIKLTEYPPRRRMGNLAVQPRLGS